VARRVFAVFALGAVVVTGCAREAAPTGTITGHVLAGPTCPVETIGSPCPPAPWEGTVRATASNGTRTEVRTDGEGGFTVSLPPGPYTVAAVTDDGVASAIPIELEVTAGVTQRVDLEVDTGIR
jgi:hypothetical protein